MTCIRINRGILCVQPTFKPGDLPPEGYLAWHEWAEVQHKAGLRQKECGRCMKWQYPQQLSGKVDECNAKDRRGNMVIVRSHVCTKCAAIANGAPK